MPYPNGQQEPVHPYIAMRTPSRAFGILSESGRNPHVSMCACCVHTGTTCGGNASGECGHFVLDEADLSRVKQAVEPARL